MNRRFRPTVESEPARRLLDRSTAAAAKRGATRGATRDDAYVENAAWRHFYARRMAEIEELPVRVALAKRLAYRCPICRLIHPGIRYQHSEHREFCSKACFDARDR